jgi:hypothetical protein
LSEAANEEKSPVWVQAAKHPDDKAFSYTVGVASLVEKIELGMEQAWANGLEGFARTRFPHLQNVMQFSKETLNGTTYERMTALKLDSINWEGVSEASELGSPFVKEHIRQNGDSLFTVYRLLKWEKKTLQTELHRQAKKDSNEMIRATKRANEGKGSLTIITIPDNAIVQMNNEIVGQSNLALTGLAVGTYRVKIQKDGFENYEEDIAVDEINKTNKIKLKKKTANLRVLTKPEGALVLIDNIPFGRTPLSLQKELGGYKIELQLDGYQNQSREMTHALPETEISEILVQKPGLLTVLTMPPNAKIELNDNEIGKSPVLRRSVKGGSHKIRISMEGYQTLERNVEISGIKETTLTIRLQTEGSIARLERAGFERLMLRRRLYRSDINDSDRKRILELGCNRGFVEYCFDLLEIPSLGDDRLLKQSQSELNEKVSLIINFWRERCQQTLVHRKCSELVAQAVGLALAHKNISTRKEAASNNVKGTEKQRAWLKPLVAKFQRALVGACKGNRGDTSSDFLCAFVSELNENNLVKSIENICNESDNGSACSSLAAELMSTRDDLNKFGIPIFIPDIYSRIERIASVSCLNIGFYEFSGLVDSDIPEICTRGMTNPEKFKYYFENCIVKKNSRACKKFVDLALDESKVKLRADPFAEYATTFKTDIARLAINDFGEDLLAAVKAKCEHGDSYLGCLISPEVEEIVSQLKLEKFLRQRACSLGSWEDCREIGMNNEAFHISATECILASHEKRVRSQSGECAFAFGLRNEVDLSNFGFSKDTIRRAACIGGVADSCIEGGKLKKKNFDAVIMNCGLGSKKKNSIKSWEHSLIELNWNHRVDSPGFCSKVFHALDGDGKESKALRAELLNTGCSKYQNILMCAASKNVGALKLAYIKNCRSVQYDKLCESVSSDFSISEKKEFCLKNKVSNSCKSLGYHFASLKDHQSAFEYFEIGCVSGNEWDCYNAGFQAYIMSKWADAKSRLKMACDKKIYDACENLGLVYQKIGLSSEAFNMFVHACDQGDVGGSCEFAGLSKVSCGKSQYYLRKAQSIYRRQCDDGDNEACASLKSINEFLRE